MRLTMRRLSWVFLALGLGLLAWLLQSMEVRQMWNAALQIGWGGLLLIPVAFLWLIPNTKAWACAFKTTGPTVAFSKLLTAHIAGESLNGLLPSSSLGGEPVKALLLQPKVTFAEALSSVTVSKTTQTLSLVIFLLGGMGLAAWQTNLPPGLWLSTAGIVAMLSFGAIMLTWGTSSGLLRDWASSSLRRWPNAEWLKSPMAHVIEIDEHLAAFYHREKKRFIASTLWHCAGLFLGFIEIYMIAYFLGLSLSPTGALIMEAVAALAAVGGFFIPGSLGTYEFGHYVAASMLGIPPASGIMICLLRRVRELFWLVIGLTLLYFHFPDVWKAATNEAKTPTELRTCDP